MVFGLLFVIEVQLQPMVVDHQPLNDDVGWAIVSKHEGHNISYWSFHRLWWTKSVNIDYELNCTISDIQPSYLIQTVSSRPFSNMEIINDQDKTHPHI